MRCLPAIAAAVLGLASCATALAQDRQQAPTLKVEVEGQTVAVPAPFGYCDLDPGQPRDRLLAGAFDRLARDARILRRMSPCDELETWRANKAKAPIEVVLTMFDTHVRMEDSEDRDVFLERVAPGEPMGKDSVIAEARKGFRAGSRSGEPVTIGLIERTDRAAFHAATVMASIDGEDRKLTVLATWTAVESTPLLIRVYSPYEDGTEIDWMFRDSREHVDRLLGANGEPSRRFRQSRPEPPPAPPPVDVRTRKTRMPRERTTDFFGNNGGYIALGMVIGGALLIGIGVISARRLKPAP